MIEQKPKRRIQSYDRHSVAPIDEIIVLIKDVDPNCRKPKALVNGNLVGITSLRLQTFATKGTVCVSCGTKAEYFALERNVGKNSVYHLNLWGTDKDGDPVLFTHDHILARSLGGKDVIENSQPMCCHCNWEKGDLEHVLVQEAKQKEIKV